MQKSVCVCFPQGWNYDKGIVSRSGLNARLKWPILRQKLPEKSRGGAKNARIPDFPKGHYIFFLLPGKQIDMDFMPMIFGFVVAYGAFILVGYVLARLIFPSLEDEATRKQKKTRFRS